MLTVTGPTAAAELGVSVPTLRRMAAAGLIPVAHIPGRHPRYNAEAVRDLADRPAVSYPDPVFAVRLAPAAGPQDGDGEVDLLGWHDSWYGTPKQLRALAGWWAVDPVRVLQQTDVIAAFVGGIGVGAARITGIAATHPNTHGRRRVQFNVAPDAVDAEFRLRWWRNAPGWASGILTRPISG